MLVKSNERRGQNAVWGAGRGRLRALLPPLMRFSWCAGGARTGCHGSAASVPSARAMVVVVGLREPADPLAGLVADDLGSLSPRRGGESDGEYEERSHRSLGTKRRIAFTRNCRSIVARRGRAPRLSRRARWYGSSAR